MIKWHAGLIFKLQTYDVDAKLLKLLKSYLKDLQQRVLLNRQTSLWKNIFKKSVLVSLLCLIYENDSPDGLTSVCKIFADDTSLCLKTIDRKIVFNPDPTKQATAVCFSQKRDDVSHELLTFNNKIQSAPAPKHLGLILDSKLDFNQHIHGKISKCNKIIGIMGRLSMTLSRKILLTMYTTLVRCSLDRADIINHVMNCSK